MSTSRPTSNHKTSPTRPSTSHAQAASTTPTNPSAPTSISTPARHSIPASSSKLARNKKLPATMITPSGSVEPSGKKGKGKQQATRKQKIRSERGKEKAVELSGKLETKVKEREERKAKRMRAKNAWE